MKFHRYSLHFAKQQSCQTVHLELIRNEKEWMVQKHFEKYEESMLILVSLCIWRLVRVIWSHNVVCNTAGITGNSWPRLCSPQTCFQYFNGHHHHFYQERLIQWCLSELKLWLSVPERKGFLGHHVQLQLLWQSQHISRPLLNYISELGFLSSFIWGRRK